MALVGDGAVVAVAVVLKELPKAGDCVDETWKTPPPWLTVRLRMGSEEGGVVVVPSASVKAGEMALAVDISALVPLPLVLCDVWALGLATPPATGADGEKGVPNCDDGVVPVVALLIKACEGDPDVAMLPAMTGPASVKLVISCPAFASAWLAT